MGQGGGDEYFNLNRTKGREPLRAFAETGKGWMEGNETLENLSIPPNPLRPEQPLGGPRAIPPPGSQPRAEQG